jgi:hypothetical protein
MGWSKHRKYDWFIQICTMDLGIATDVFGGDVFFIKLLSAEKPLASADGMKAVLLNQNLAKAYDI